jgi:hypothetical protein
MLRACEAGIAGEAPMAAVSARGVTGAFLSSIRPAYGASMPGMVAQQKQRPLGVASEMS